MLAGSDFEFVWILSISTRKKPFEVMGAPIYKFHSRLPMADVDGGTRLSSAKRHY